MRRRRYHQRGRRTTLPAHHRSVPRPVLSARLQALRSIVSVGLLAQRSCSALTERCFTLARAPRRGSRCSGAIYLVCVTLPARCSSLNPGRCQPCSRAWSRWRNKTGTNSGPVLKYAQVSHADSTRHSSSTGRVHSPLPSIRAWDSLRRRVIAAVSISAGRTASSPAAL